VTLLLDLPLDEGLRRVQERGTADRLERADDTFHRRVSAAFQAFLRPEWQEVHGECGPVRAVDARGTPAEVHDRIWREIGTYVPETFRGPEGSQQQR
jgi:thymidylate kinase